MGYDAAGENGLAAAGNLPGLVSGQTAIAGATPQPL
jgi:hypothetical protein